MDNDEYLRLLELEQERRRRQSASKGPLQRVADAAEKGVRLADQTAQGLTFGTADEMRSAIAAGTVGAAKAIGQRDLSQIGQTYKDAQDAQKQFRETTKEQMPVSSFAAEVAGAAPYGGAGVGKSLAARMATGAGIGGAYSGAYAVGTGEGDLGERLDGAKDNAAMGAAIGAAFPVAGTAGRYLFGGKARESKQAIEKVVDDFGDEANQAWDAVRDSGQTLDSPLLKSVASQIRKRLADADVGPEDAPSAYRIADKVDAMPNDSSLANLYNKRRLANKLTGEFDDISSKVIKDTLDENFDQITPLVSQARNASMEQKRVETIANQLIKAERAAAKSGSGQNIDNALRQKVSEILNNPSAARAFTKAEKELMDGFVNGSVARDTLRSIGNKLTGFMGGAGGAFAGHFVNPLLYGIPVLGYGAKRAENLMARKSGEKLFETIAKRTLQKSGTPVTPERIASLAAIIGMQEQKQSQKDAE